MIAVGPNAVEQAGERVCMALVLVGAAIAWALSQVAKVLVSLARVGVSDVARIPWRLVWAGGMPSSHAAFVSATVVLVGLQEGMRSPIFAVAFVLAAIVIYDRAKLYHVYDVFQRQFPALSTAVSADPVLRDLVGHTPLQVLAGTSLGVASALAFWMTQR
jgi:acid phosphatase family membrane protein YuiD